MARYQYKARDRRGNAVSGSIDADTAQAASAALGSRGLVPVSIRENAVSAGLAMPVWGTRPVSQQEINVFTRQLWTLYRAGIPLLAGLLSLKEQARSERFRRILAQIIEDLEAGASLSASLARHPRVFSMLYVNTVKAGEASGRLDEIFHRLATMGEFQLETQEKVKAATRYPLLAFSSLVAAFFLVVTFVVPRFSVLFAQFKQELPVPTKILLALHGAITHYWIAMIAGVAALAWAGRWYAGTEAGGYQWDLLKIRVPVLGRLTFNLLMSRFSKILAELLGSGLPILQALQLVSESVGNRVIERAVLQIRDSVNEGKTMSEPMKKSGLFAPMVVQMVAVGEQSGKTDELLSHVADYYEDQANLMIKNLTTLIEPVLVVVLGGMVTFLALGVFLPTWNLVNVIR